MSFLENVLAGAGVLFSIFAICVAILTLVHFLKSKEVLYVIAGIGVCWCLGKIVRLFS